MDKRLKQITKGFTQYIRGNFDWKLPVAGAPDELNACMFAFNVLGQEAKARTISRDYFNNIVDSVWEMIFVIDIAGIIKYVNKAVLIQLERDKPSIIDTNISLLQPDNAPVLQNRISKVLQKGSAGNTIQTVFSGTQGSRMAVLLTINWLHSGKKKRKEIVVTAKNITAQEKERQRLAREVHDGLGQDIAAIKFYISTAVSICGDSSLLQILHKADKGLQEVEGSVRQICADLMPLSLQEKGLQSAVRSLCRHRIYKGSVRFRILISPVLRRFEKTVELDIFRIIQEVINNATTHGKATEIIIGIQEQDSEHLEIKMQDNGIGFRGRRPEGRGIDNIYARVRSHGGECRISTAPEKGTAYHITLNPLLTLNELEWDQL